MCICLNPSVILIRISIVHLCIKLNLKICAHSRYADVYKVNDHWAAAGKYYMYNVQCTGREDSIDRCRQSWNIHSCSDKSILAVSCGEYKTINTL